MRILPGSLGSFSGLKTDEQARVLMRASADRWPLRHGNDVERDAGYYPSGGITLGPAMTFGYLVGKHWPPI